ncbi:MAG: cation diffusion facilitator family transporter [Parabacteroides sp.]|nr:cation diffusion facilitator family transporter [Parabacteroides sp.]
METVIRKRELMRITFVGSVGNLILLLFKFVAGIWGHSSAMLADAVHSLSDFVTDVVVIVFVNISSKPKDAGHDYGHGKYETLATSIIGLALLVVGVSLFWDSLHKVFDYWVLGKPLESPGWIALMAALVSILIKELLFQITYRVGKRQNSQAVIANAWHHRSDALSSIGTTLGIGGAILLGPDWHVLDPLAAMVVSVFIVKVSLELMIPAINDLLEQSLPKEVENEILSIISENPKVKEPHNLRTRRIGNDFAIEVHIRVDGDMSVREAHALTKEIERKLYQKYGNTTHVVIHVEPFRPK